MGIRTWDIGVGVVEVAVAGVGRVAFEGGEQVFPALIGEDGDNPAVMNLDDVLPLGRVGTD